MITRFNLFVCFFVLFNLEQITSEPIRRRYNYVGPFSRYPTNIPPTQPNYEDNYDYEYLNNISLGRILQDDYSLIQQTENLNSQLKSSIANRLMNLASRLQHAASLIMQGESRRLHRQNSHRNYKPKYIRPSNYPRPNPSNTESDSSSRPNSNNPKLSDPFTSNNPRDPFASNNPSNPAFDSSARPNSNNPFAPNNRNPKLDQLSTIKPSTIETSTPDSIEPKSTPDSIGPKSTVPKLKLTDLLPSSTTDKPSTPDTELSGRSMKRNEELDDKKRQDEEESDGFVKRGKREVERIEYRPTFSSVTKKQLAEVSDEVRTGYNNVIKLLKGYLDDPPITNRPNLKRNNLRAEQMLENIEQAKKIFVQIEDYVSQQFLDNQLANRTQIELLNYFDQIIRVEKNRISQALNEYDTALATDYRLPATSSTTHPNKPVTPAARTSVPDYQNDDDRDLHKYVNQRRREVSRGRTGHRTNYYNEIASDDKLINREERNGRRDERRNERIDERRNERDERDERPTIIVRRVYIPPKVVKVEAVNSRRSRPTRRQPVSESVKPAYEVSVSNKEPIEIEDDGGYEMIEP